MLLSQKVWKSDGTLAGTVLVKDINPGATGSSITGIIAFGTNAVLSANNSTNGKELWITDGTDAGTVMLKDINNGSGSSNPASFANANGYVYFYANDGTGGYDIWKTDGTNAGTQLVSELEGNSGSSLAYPIFSTGSVLYVIANTPANGLQLWNSSQVFPVSFISNSAVCSNNRVRINWRTANEDNCEKYQIQGTLGGSLWKTLQEVNIDGTNNPSHSYEWISDGNQYSQFRIKSIDKDGTYRLSASMMINCSEDNRLSLFPTPATNKVILNFRSSQVQNIYVEVMDISGRIVLSEKASLVKGNNLINLDVQNLPNGQYFIRFAMLENTVVSKFIISR